MANKLKKIEKAIAKRDYEVMVELSKDKDKEVRLAAIDGLIKIKDDIGINTLILLLSDPDADIRIAAARGLGSIGNDHAKVHLEHRIAKETDENIIKIMTECKNMLKSHSA